jgi:hypothetical protein
MCAARRASARDLFSIGDDAAEFTPVMPSRLSQFLDDPESAAISGDSSHHAQRGRGASLTTPPKTRGPRSHDESRSTPSGGRRNRSSGKVSLVMAADSSGGTASAPALAQQQQASNGSDAMGSALPPTPDAATSSWKAITGNITEVTRHTLSLLSLA